LPHQVHQGNLTHQQALERLAVMQASAHSFQEQSAPQQLLPGSNAGAMPSGTTQQQIATLSQRAHVSANNQINTLQRVIQAQDPSHSRQFNMLLPAQQQQQQQLQQSQQQQQQQQSQQSGGELMHGGVMNLSLPQQQVCLPQLAVPLVVSVKISVTSTYILICAVSLGASHFFDAFVCALFHQLVARGPTPFCHDI